MPRIKYEIGSRNVKGKSLGLRSLTSAVLGIALVISAFLPLPKAQAAFTPIELITYTNGQASNIADMKFLATRSQKKPLSKSGATSPYLMSHVNSDPSLSYSYLTDANYGTSHSGCTNCAAQLYESDVRNESGMTYSYLNSTSTSATLSNTGHISSTPDGGSSSNTNAGGLVTFGSVFGPEVWSKPFLATVGQSVSFEWKASGGSDDYEVYGFLVKVAAGASCSASTDFGGTTQAEKLASHTVLSHSRGLTASTYRTSVGNISSDGCFRFRFVNGTYDASGGYAVGATFYIQNPLLGLAQTISFSQVADQITSSSISVPLVATTNASQTVTFTKLSGSCTVSGTTVTASAGATGLCSVRADAAPIGEYSAAPTAYMSFNLLAAATKPVYSGGAQVSGSALVCSTVTVTEGSWATGGSAYTDTSYQWLRDGSEIAGETTNSYVLTPSDLGKSISFTVSKTNSVGTTTATSNSLLILDARLSSLGLSAGTLSPTFSECESNYSLSVSTSTLELTPAITAGTESLELGGSQILSGQPTNPISLSPGANTVTLTLNSGAYSRDVVLTVNYLSAPLAVALAPSFTNGTSLTLSALVNANGFATSSISFVLTDLSATPGTFTQESISPATVSGTGDTSVTQSVTGLTSGATYSFSVVAENANGSTTSSTITFQTPDAPAAETGLASNVTSSSASIAGTVLGYSYETSVLIKYGTSPDLSGGQTESLTAISAANAATVQNVSGTLSNLTLGTTYYYRIEATNSVGSNFGDIKSFVTAAAPTITHGVPTVAERSATLTATINPNGSDTTGNITFIYATDSSFTSPVSVVATPSSVVGSSDRTIQVTLTSLVPTTSYWFKVTATNSVGTTTTSADQFTTLADPVPSAVLTAPTSVVAGSSVGLTVSFSESVSGFTSSDLSISGSPTYTAGIAQDLGAGVYSVTLSTTSSSTGTVTIGLAANKVVDLLTGSQPNTAATSISVTIASAISAPVISYGSANLAFNVGSTVSQTPTNSGGAVATWSISPTLPTGLSFSLSTGLISGVPNSIFSSTSFTVTATNAGGSGTSTFTILVNPAAPVITYTPSIITTSIGGSISVIPINLGGDITSFSISPNLPQGLEIDPTTGEISGIGTSEIAATSYVITATNAGGSGTATVSIQIFDPTWRGPVVTRLNPSGFGVPTSSNPVNVTIEGLKLETVISAEIAGKKIAISVSESGELKFDAPIGLTPGTYDLVLYGDFGRLTVQDALVIYADTTISNCPADLKVWTKKISSQTVRFYAKSVSFENSVRYEVGGNVISSLAPENPPSLVAVEGCYYFLQNVNLRLGEMNRLKIFVDNNLAWKASYFGRIN